MAQKKKSTPVVIRKISVQKIIKEAIDQPLQFRMGKCILALHTVLLGLSHIPFSMQNYETIQTPAFLLCVIFCCSFMLFLILIIKLMMGQTK